MPISTSNSTDWNLVRNQIVELALRRIGKLGQGVSVSGSMLTEATTVLNAIVKELQGSGVKLWSIEHVTHIIDVSDEVLGTDGLNYKCIKTHTSGTTYKPITGDDWTTYWYQAGTAGVAWATATNYTCAGDWDVPARTWGLERAWYRYLNSDSPIEIIGREFYASITDKYKTADEPIYLMFERKPTPHITVWPIPSKASPDVVIHLHQVRRLDDLDAAGDNADVLESWVNGLAWALAAELGPEYGIPPNQNVYFQQMAESKLARLTKNDRDIESSGSISPAYTPSGHSAPTQVLGDSDDYGILKRG